MKKAIIFIIASLIGGMALGVGIVTAGALLFTDKTVGDIAATLSDNGLAVEIVRDAVLALAAGAVAGLAQIIIHEAGHLAGGLAAGYSFVSFRVFSLAIIRHKGRLALRRFSVAGTGGQCLLLPPEGDGSKVAVTLYNAGGVAANTISVAAAAVAILSIDKPGEVGFLMLLFTVIIGLLFALLNGIPMKIGGITNDGYNIRLLRRDGDSRRLFVNQLRMNAMIQEGTRPKDLPEEWFDTGKTTDFSDIMQASTHLAKASRLLDMGDTATAHGMLEDMERHKDVTIGLLVKEAECELLLTSLLLGHTEQARKLYTKELKAYINAYGDTMSSKQRVLCAVARFMDNDRDKAEKIYRGVLARRYRYIAQGEVAMDLALMESITAQSPTEPAQG